MADVGSAMLEPMSMGAAREGFTLDRECFAVAIRRSDECIDVVDVDQVSLADFSDRPSEAINILVSIAQDGHAVLAPEDLVGLDLEIVVYAHDDEYDSDVMVAVRPRHIGAPGVSSAFRYAQVATMLSDTRDYGPRDASGMRECGVEALATTVEAVLDDASGLLPLLRAAIAGSSDASGAWAESAWLDAAALERIAEILRDPEWGVGMLEDIAAVVTTSGRSLDNPTGEPTWSRH